MASTLTVDNIVGATTAANITMPAAMKSTGTPIQVVHATVQTHPQYSSTSYVATDVQVAITPKFADSKFLIEAVFSGGTNGGNSNNHDCLAGLNFRDSLNPSGANAPIVTDNASGAGSNRTGGFMLLPSTAAVASVLQYWVHQIPMHFFYTPSYQNTNTRTFGVIIKVGNSAQGTTQNMSDTNTDSRFDIRGSSTIKVTEIAG